MGFLAGRPGGDSTLARTYATILPHADLVEMWQPRYDADAPGMPPERVGMSFFIFPRGADTLVGHTGEQAGFRSFMFINPRTGTGVVGVFNTRNDAESDKSSTGFNAIVEQAIGLLRRGR